MIGGSADLAFRAQLIVPEQRQIYDYWVERAGGRPMPARRDINPAHVPRLLPSISLVDVEERPQRFRIRLAGTRLREIYDREITGSYLDDLDDWGCRRQYWQAAYARVVEAGRPAQGVVRGPKESKEHLVQFWLRLPLSSDGDRVDMILSYDAFVAAGEPGAELATGTLAARALAL